MKPNISKLIFCLLFCIGLHLASYAQDLLKVLTDKFGVDNVISKDSSAFKEYYEIRFRQPVDHRDTSRGFFTQLLLLGHNDVTRPMIIETNGYEILPYQGLQYVAEPAKLLKGNQLIAEHRYFGASIPDSNNHTYLNFKQVSSDYHAIRNAFADIYKSEWISTGASKGGLTALNYSFYYPEDINASIIYVAPILTSVEDKRIELFLKEKRQTETGKRLFTIQQNFLTRKQVLLPVFLDILKLSNLELGKMDPETLYDFAVLEFDFNYWQYISDFPKLLDKNRRILNQLSKNGLANTSALQSEDDSLIALFPMCIWYMLTESLSRPFFYQSFTQMGSYGYEEQLFNGLKHKKYSPEFLAGNHPGFSRKYVRTFTRFLRKDLKNTVCIYGAEDPWTSCRISTSEENLVIINPKTNHATLIKDVGEAPKKEIEKKLNDWLVTEVVVN